MGTLNDRFASMASRLTTKYGAPALLRRVVVGNFDPETMTDSGGATIQDEVKVVIEDYRAFEINTYVQYGDKKVTVASSDVQNLVSPRIGDTLVVENDQYRVLNVESTYAEDKTVIHRLQVRK